MRTLGVVLLALASALSALARRKGEHLTLYFLDVEGGQATLIVAPSGRSMLIDTGWPGQGGRDADRIVAAAKMEGLRRIDTVLITHFHTDHVGGVPEVVERIPVGAFLDHGTSIETGTEAAKLAAAYASAVRKGQHRRVKPGDRIPLKGVNVRVLTSDGEHIETSLSGAGQPNPFCADVVPGSDDPSDNARSVGILLKFGKFRFIDLGDLTWNKELDLVCPQNRAGTVDVYLTSHHGLKLSGPKALVWALHPRVAIMNNGARKGGDRSAWQIVRSSPGLEGLWQLHYAIAGGAENNADESYIANLDEKCEGKYLKLSAQADGSFTVTNSRNGFTKTYSARN